VQAQAKACGDILQGPLKISEFSPFHLFPVSPRFLDRRVEFMDIPLARKVNGKKFMWDGVVYDSDAQATKVMEDYAKDGFEVQKFVEDGRFLVYSRRLAEAAAPSG